MPTTRPSFAVPLDDIFADPQTAPLLPVTTAADATEYYAAFVTAANERPSIAPQLARYARRHPKPVASALSAVLFNRHGDVSLAAIEALLAAPDVKDIQPVVRFLSEAVDAVSPTVDDRRAYDIAKPVRSRTLQKRLLRQIDRRLMHHRGAVPMEAALDIAAQGDARGRDALIGVQNAAAVQRAEEALREARQVRDAARRGGHAKSNRRKRGKRFL